MCATRVLSTRHRGFGYVPAAVRARRMADSTARLAGSVPSPGRYSTRSAPLPRAIRGCAHAISGDGSV